MHNLSPKVLSNSDEDMQLRMHFQLEPVVHRHLLYVMLDSLVDLRPVSVRASRTHSLHPSSCEADCSWVGLDFHLGWNVLSALIIRHLSCPLS